MSALPPKAEHERGAGACARDTNLWVRFMIDGADAGERFSLVEHPRSPHALVRCVRASISFRTKKGKTIMNELPKAKIKGTQGNWLVAVTIKGEKPERLPTAHFAFLNGMDYVRTDGEMAKRKGKYEKWHDALLKNKKIVLTNDKWVGEPGTVG
jgi:hypothetical protein